MILVDAGPLVALVDRSDQNHSACVAAARTIREPLGTVWPVVAEAMSLLIDLPNGQDAVWEMLERSAIRLMRLDSDDIPRIRQLMRQYADRRMDLADAALVHVAERERLEAVFTVDHGDFQIYRRYGRKAFRLILGTPPGRRGRR